VGGTYFGCGPQYEANVEFHRRGRLAPCSVHPLPIARMSHHPNQPSFEFVDLTRLPPLPCPCGTARRAFTETTDFPATVHLTEISQDAKPHRHQRLTEVYVVLKCDPDAALEIDGRRIPVQPLSAVLIRPGAIHRAVGKMQVLIICHPKFDPQDEFLTG